MADEKWRLCLFVVGVEILWGWPVFHVRPFYSIIFYKDFIHNLLIMERNSYDIVDAAMR